jgi:hypothetical protein
MPLLTTVYPYSQLTIKSGLVLYELFKDRAISMSNTARSNRNFLNRVFRTYYMGRWPRVLNTDFLLRVIGIYAVVVVALPWLAISTFYRGRYREIEQVYQALGTSSADISTVTASLFLWLCATVVLTWTRDVDRLFLYSLRARSLAMAAFAGLTLTLIWLVSGLLVGLGIYAFVDSAKSRWTTEDVGAALLIAVAVGVTALFMALYLRRGLRAIVLDARYVEGGFQIAFSTAIGFIVALGAIWGPKLFA